jgi:ribosomal protein S18 acetylase RimI-like enzyme
MKINKNFPDGLIIRKAVPKDAKALATYLLLAMEDIVFRFTGEANRQKGYEFLLYFAAGENNQYSWQNCVVAEEKGIVTGAVNVYDGARLQDLRRPVTEYLKRRFNRDIVPEDETEAGEIYIDTLAVDPAKQGQGIGSSLLRFVMKEYSGHTLGILVDEENPDALKLYTRLGFIPAGKKTLMGKPMIHLRLNV